MKLFTTDQLDDIATQAVTAALDVVDAKFQNSNKASGPLGDDLAFRLHDIIEKAIREAAGRNYITDFGFPKPQINCGACTVAIGAHTRDENCRLGDDA